MYIIFIDDFLPFYCSIFLLLDFCIYAATFFLTTFFFGAGASSSAAAT